MNRRRELKIKMVVTLIMWLAAWLILALRFDDLPPGSWWLIYAILLGASVAIRAA